MMMPSVNWVAVVVAGLVPMGVGFLWYGPLFGKMWMKESGFSKADLEKMKKSMGPGYAITLVGAMVMSYVLANVVMFANATTMTAGAMVGFWSWLGFIATSRLNDRVFEGKSWNLYGLNVGYYLVSLVVMGAILAVWK